jgi:hypothetical protein
MRYTLHDILKSIASTKQDTLIHVPRQNFTFMKGLKNRQQLRHTDHKQKDSKQSSCRSRSTPLNNSSTVSSARYSQDASDGIISGLCGVPVGTS